MRHSDRTRAEELDASSLRNKSVRHRCVGYGKEFPHSFNPFCDCGHMVDVEYDLKGARLYDSTNPYIRYFDLLPLESPESLLPVRQTMTPTHHAMELGKLLGLRWLYLKDETVLPTRTTKDRMAVVVLSFFREVGVKEFACSSTGNSSTALAHWIPCFPQCKMHVFTGQDFLDRLNFAETDQVNVIALRGGTFVEAFAEAAQFAKRTGVASEGGFFNPARREGLKTTFLEGAESVPRPIDWYVQAVSSAMGVYGAYKGAKEFLAMGHIVRLPRLLCVQQATCCPMVSAFEAGSKTIRPEDIVRRPTGIASAILRGDPTRVYPYVREIVVESGGTFASVNEGEIRQARRMVEEYEGLSPCFTASTAVAGLVRLAKEGLIHADQTVLVNLTGADRGPQPPLGNVNWLDRTPEGWRAGQDQHPPARELRKGTE